jgi:pimeloyl-ACP methyl ester carboxylesterase
VQNKQAGNEIRKGSIGLIVIGSVLTGFITALALVIGPLAGRQEHVIVAGALLGWAVGWALLATLSSRRTQQPQRWAMKPAALMSLIAILLLIFKPHANAFNVLGWIWPPSLIALTVWMILQVRRSLHSHTRRFVLYPLFGTIFISGIGATYERVQEQVDRSTATMPGRLVDVGGRRLHLHCTGSGSPTVVLVSGLAETSSYWSGWITPAVAQTTTVCAYDRAGQGWSDPPSKAQDGIAVAGDLYEMLHRANISGPYVLVGHSTGGVYARIFAAHHSDEVSGMVLLDSQPNDAFTGLPGFPSFYGGIRRASALFPSLARVGVFRLAGRFVADPLPPQARHEEQVVTATGNLQRIQRDEFINLPATLKAAAALTSIGNRPLIVVTAVQGAQAGWIPLQDAMAGLSTNSAHRVLPDVDHDGLIHSKAGAAQSSQAIIDVVASVRTGTPVLKGITLGN